MNDVDIKSLRQLLRVAQQQPTLNAGAIATLSAELEKRTGKGGMKSKREMQFRDLWIQRFSHFPFVCGHRFSTSRNYELDFACCLTMVGVEIEGIFGNRTNGKRRLSRHQTFTGYTEDCVKYNLAQELGWIVLRYTQHDLDKRPDYVLGQVDRVMASRRGTNGQGRQGDGGGQ